MAENDEGKHLNGCFSPGNSVNSSVAVCNTAADEEQSSADPAERNHEFGISPNPASNVLH